MHLPEPLLHEKHVSQITNITVTTLQYFRRIGKGPKYMKLGRLVRYRLEDVNAWIEGNAQVTSLK